ncbi:MAG: efflux RND transporter periplasmic adaptor subunit [Phycisphaerales bacterium]
MHKDQLRLFLALAAAAMAAGVGLSHAASRQPESPASSAAEGSAAGPKSWEERAATFGGDEWVTRPSRDAALGFTTSLEIQEILIKPGQRVKEGTRLIRARDGEVLAGIALQELRATNRSEVENAEAARDLAQSRFDAVEKVMLSDAGTEAEFEERRIGLVSAKIGVAAALKTLEEEVLRLAQLREQAQRYYINAPFDGIVDQLVGEVGQAVTERDPVVRVVDIDPLWIDVPVRTETTISERIAPGHQAWALLDLPGEPVVLTGRVLYVSAVADSASGTRRVRVEVDNPDEWPAATRARVRFSQPALPLATAAHDDGADKK